VPDGTYVITSTLQVGSNTHLHLDSGAVLEHAFVVGDVNATIRNKDYATTGNVNIRISGGVIRTVGATYIGKHLLFYSVSGLQIDGVRFSGVKHDWNTLFRDCTYVTISNVAMLSDGSTLHEDGLHFAGGRWIAVTNCVIVSGDDCLALSNETETNPATDLTDVAVSNCTFHSLRANAVRLLVTPAITKAVLRVRIANIVAKCGDGTYAGAGISIQNQSSPGLISDVEFDGVTLDASQSSTECVDIDNVARLRFHRLVVRQPNYRIAIDGSSYVELDDCIVDSPRGVDSQCVLVAASAACFYVRIIGGAYWSAKQHGIQLGTAANAIVGFAVSGVEVTDSANSGLYVRNASNGLVSGNIFRTCSQYGIVEDAAGFRNAYIANYFVSNSLGTAQFNGQEVQAIRNVSNIVAVMPDSGGFRQTIDGFTRTGIAGTLAAIPMTRGDGRFRAARPGSVTGVVLTTSKPRTGGSMKVTVFKNTGDSGAAGASILFSATIDGTTAANRAYKTQPMDSVGADFAPGDEVYAVIESTGWTVATPPTDAFCAIEIED
jgi:hypothetical protein